MTTWVAVTFHENPLNGARFAFMEEPYDPDHPQTIAVDDRIRITASSGAAFGGIVGSVTGKNFTATFGDVTMEFSPSDTRLPPMPITENGIPMHYFTGMPKADEDS